MRKPILKGTICGFVFLFSVIIISLVTNKGNTDMTLEMQPATYPVIHMVSQGEKINDLHGYGHEMNVSFMRDSITPMQSDRKLGIIVDKYKTAITDMKIQVRSVDGERLIEETPVKDYEENEDTITANVTIKDLIEEKEEYSLIVVLTTQNKETIYYYTRIIQAEEYHAKEKIDFVKDFLYKTFKKDESISKYLESNAEGDNTTYQYVNIHSSFNQITWGTLNAEMQGEPDITIKELDTETASIRTSYFVKENDNRYRVEEYYRIRFGSERIYLLDFERKMTQQFDSSKKDSFANNKIILGITDKEIALDESDDGNIIAFCQDNNLYSYNAISNKYVTLYSFYDERNQDARDFYNQHGMKIMSVEESGNIRFMVYGYMNRGRHEGDMGIQLFYYNSVLNTIEEETFVRYDKSYELLKEEIEQLSYVSKNNIFYFILEGTVYSVNLMDKNSSVIISNLTEDSYMVSDNNEMIAWQKEKEKYNNTQLTRMNLNTQKKTTVEAPANTRISPLGFMNTDLVYGLAKVGDITKNQSGMITFPMEKVVIENEEGTVLKEYQQEGIYVVDAAFENNQMNMKRVKKIGTDGAENESPEEETVSGNSLDDSEGIMYSSSQYEAVADDQIMNNAEEKIMRNSVETVATEYYEKIVQIALVGNIQVGGMKLQTPKEVLFEGGREIWLSEPSKADARYYVYGKNGIEEILTTPAEAIHLADSISGVVLNDRGSYVWKKGNRAAKNQIMKIREPGILPDSSAAVCLDTILSYEGVSKNSEYLLKNGETVYSILKENLEKAEILMLNGCSLDAILYYVNQDIPVMAMLNDGNAVLIIGFNELNTVIMNPKTGTIYKMGMNDSAKWFEENGNSFVTYIRGE